jgi:hypothetical protein
MVVVALLAGCCHTSRPVSRPTPSRPLVARDALTASATDVEELHRASKRVACLIGPIRPSDPDSSRTAADAYMDRLKLCREKGFDAVILPSPAPALHRRASELGLTLAAGAEEG